MGRSPRSELLLPELNEEMAKVFGQAFFAWRQAESKLQTLSLKTGERLRRFPQWPPAYQSVEESVAKIVHIRRPASHNSELVIEVKRE